jgi:hypothetical protein
VRPAWAEKIGSGANGVGYATTPARPKCGWRDRFYLNDRPKWPAHGRAVAADDEPVAVVLDLMIPIGSGWRRGRERRQAWLDEAFGREHAKAIRSATQEKSHPCCPAAWARPLTPADEVQAKVLTEDDARRVAVNITRLTALLGG